MSDTKEMVNQNLIYKCIHGSTAYGLATPESDVDVKGIFIPTEDYYFGTKVIEQQEIPEEGDCVIYAIKKFVILAMDCNPNIIEMLFVDDRDVIFQTKWGQILRDNRDLFLSTKVYYTFSGYAYSQLKRIRGHQRWIMNPQQRPVEEDFFVTKVRQTITGPKEYQHFQEVEFDKALKKYQQYIDWKENRNDKRAELEEKYGFDTKHGMHLMRLLRMGKEILQTGTVRVKRPDREELLAIRHGEWSYERLVEEAEKAMVELESIYKNPCSVLQKTINREALDRLLMFITREYFKEKSLA